MILTPHIPLIHEILSLPAFLKEPVLSFGYHDVLWHPELRALLNIQKINKATLRIPINLSEMLQKKIDLTQYAVDVPWQFMEDQFNDILFNYGISNITTIDLFDQRADHQHDMNTPVPDYLRKKFNTIIDIGSVEHVFDTKQCLDNLFQMLCVGGHLMLHLPCHGCFDHGFYTFSPEVIIESLRLNGFEIIFLVFSAEPEGIKMEKPVTWSDCILWCVARKIRHVNDFIIPQQNGCKAMYGLEEKKDTSADV